MPPENAPVEKAFSLTFWIQRWWRHFGKIIARGDNIPIVQYVNHFLEDFITDGVYWTHIFGQMECDCIGDFGVSLWPGWIQCRAVQAPFFGRLSWRGIIRVRSRCNTFSLHALLILHLCCDFMRLNKLCCGADTSLWHYLHIVCCWLILLELNPK